MSGYGDPKVIGEVADGGTKSSYSEYYLAVMVMDLTQVLSATLLVKIVGGAIVFGWNICIFYSPGATHGHFC
jgi:hypothetical protein